MAVNSVRNAFVILRHLADIEPQGVNAVARALDLSPSSCFNLLKTLVEEGLVSFDPKTKKYTLEPLATRMFAREPDMAEWSQWLRVQLRGLADAHLLSCGLWLVRRDRLVLKEVIESPDPTRVYLSVGQRLPIHIGAMGRCVAARQGLTRSDISRLVTQLRWQAPPAADALWQDISLAGERGWAIDKGNYIRGLTSIAAPICSTGGVVRYCLSGTAFADQHDSMQLAAIGAQMAELATSAQKRLLRVLEE